MAEQDTLYAGSAGRRSSFPTTSWVRGTQKACAVGLPRGLCCDPHLGPGCNRLVQGVAVTHGPPDAAGYSRRLTSLILVSGSCCAVRRFGEAANAVDPGSLAGCLWPITA